jgi:PAS domain S-box-containing protein
MMTEDNHKTREQLLAELSALRRENTRLRELETESAKTAEALQESEEKFRLLFENMTEGVALHEMIRDDEGRAVDYRILNVNSAYAQQTGISSERAHGALAGELYGAGAPPYLKEYEELVSAGKPLFFETYFSPMKKYFSISALRTKPDRFATVFLDITGRKLTEQAIKESEERYRIAIEGSIDGVVIVQDDLHAYVNRAFLDMFGYATLDEIVGKHRFCTIHPDDHKRVITYARARQKGDYVPSRYAFKGIRKDGTPIDIEVSANSISYRGEKAVLAYLRDVTDRKRAENALQASEERFRSLVEVTSDLIWETNREGVFSYVSPKIKDLLGYEPDEVIGRSPLDFMPVMEAEKLAQTINGHARQRKPFVAMENWNQHRNGKLVLLQTSGVPIFNEDGRWLGFRGIDRDITDRKLAENALKESEQRLRLTLEATNDGVWDWNILTGKTIFSPSYYTMLGYEPYEFPENYESWRNLVHSDDLDRVEANIREHIKSGEGYAIELRVRTRPGDWKWILTRGKVVERDARGLALRMVGTHSDITERRRAEGLIKASLKEKEVLLKEIHHRVKNNLQVISSLLNMQSRHVHNESVGAFRESIDRIKSMTLIHDKLYRSENLSRIYFADYIADLSHELLRTYATDKRVELDLHVDPLSFDIDTAMPLGLIINELASNALKHAFPEKAGSKITIHLKSLGKEVILTISDNGIGFPENLDFRDTPSLGMQLVVTLVEQLEGTIELNGTEGTEFRITFPATGR